MVIRTEGEKKLKVAIVAGSRPELIKLAPVYWEMQASTDFQPLLCLTGQHGNLAAQMADALSLTAHTSHDLNRVTNSLSELTAQVLANVEGFLREVGAHFVVVQGDTSSTFASALAGFHAGIPVIHVEAGLRTGNVKHPFPEEGLRRMVTVISDLHFAPTAQARKNLLSEGVSDDAIHVVGNTVVDAMNRMMPPGGLPQSGRPSVVVTAHRRENWGTEIAVLSDLVMALVRERPNVDVHWVVHPNPAVAGEIQRKLGKVPNIRLHPPLDYAQFLSLLTSASVVITDSGGVQEEATSLGIRTLIAREQTERVEGVAVGTADLLHPDRSTRLGQVLEALDEVAEGPPRETSGVYGDGHSAKRISKILVSRFGS